MVTKRKPFCRVKDITGNKYGKLTVISLDSVKNKSQTAYWLCECDCGNKIITAGSLLRNGGSKSCGCAQKEAAKQTGLNNKKDPFESSFNDLISRYIHSAKKRGFKWELTKDKAKDLFLGNCYYCGIEPQQTKHLNTKFKNGIIVYNGIDRIDTLGDYTDNNSVSCCKKCNASKSNMDIETFKDWVIRIYKHWIEDNDGELP